MRGVDMKYILCGLILIMSFTAQSKTIEEVRSAFIYQLSKFIEFAKPIDKGVQFCFFNDESGPALSLMNRKELLSHNKEIVVNIIKNFSNVTELNLNCNIIYVDDKSFSAVDAQWLSKIDNNIVVIGETVNFLELGGLAALIKEGNKIKLYINRAKLSESQTKIGSRLLALAKFFPE
jgi:hypothetical protein